VSARVGVVTVLLAGCAAGAGRGGSAGPGGGGGFDDGGGAGERDAGVTHAADSGGAGSSPADAGPTSPLDAGATAPVDAGARDDVDAGRAPGSAELWCGGLAISLCDPATQRCCAESVLHHECQPRELTCPWEWATILCDGPEDCGAGERCCADLIDVRTPTSCRPACLGPQVHLCHGASDCGPGEPFCCFFPGRFAGFCGDAEAPGADRCERATP
jgi:hypothetical protein